ncbi:MAG: hypothetical protein ACI4IF_04655 [Acutalibacteraceae bacterium]
MGNISKNKRQLKKWQKVLIGIGVSIGVLLFAFVALVIVLAVKDNIAVKNSNSSNIQVEETTSVYQQRIQDTIPSGKDDAVDVDTTPIQIKLSDKNLDEFEKYISNITVDYDYEDVYNIDAALAEYENNTKNTVTKHSHDIRLNGEFDADHFYEIVKKNNEAFIKEKEHLSGLYKEYSNKELKIICKQICDALPAIAEKDPTVDLDTVCCYLYNLRIVQKLGALDFGGFDMENRFYLNYENMETGAFAMDTDDIEQTTFYHEMMHAFQFACEDIKKPNENRMGITHTYDELEINPLSWYWLLEGSAEMNMSQYLDVRYSTYKNKIGYIHSLNIVLNLNNSNDYVQIEKICFQRDLEKFFELFDITDEKDKKEIIKMMYSIEIIQESKDDFYDWYNKTYNTDLSDETTGEQSVLRLTLKEDALMTLTKLFYRNLARQVNKGDVTLQDVYYLIRLYEADLDNHFSNNTVGYMEFFHNFYDTYLDLQNEFFSMITTQNNLSVNDLADGFENYSMNAVSKSPNCDLKFLNDDAKKYYTVEYIDRYYMKGYPSMRSCQKQAAELNEKYPFDNDKINKIVG